MPGLTAEQTRLATRLDEMQTTRDWRGIVEQEGAALALARDVRVEDPSMAGAILSALGNAHQSLGNFSQAIAYHTQDLAIAREVGDRAGEGRANGNLGNAHDSMGDFSQAIAYNTQQLAIAREVGDRAGEGKAYGNLGNAHRLMGDFAQAIAYHTQCLEIAREVGDRAGEGNAGNNLGVALEKNGNLPAAAHALVQALAAFQRVERDLGAHDDSRVSLFEQQQTTYMLLQGVLLGLEQPGWALGVAAQAKGRALLYLSTTSRRAALGTATRTTPPWSPLMARMRPYTRRGGGRCSRTRRPRATPARSASWSIRFCSTTDWPSGC